MRKWSRGLSGWPLTERRGDTYGGQPSVAVDLHGHTAMNSSRIQPEEAICRDLARPGRPYSRRSRPAMQFPHRLGHREKRAAGHYRAFTPDIRRPDLEDPIELGLAGTQLPVPRSGADVDIFEAAPGMGIVVLAGQHQAEQIASVVAHQQDRAVLAAGMV